MIQLKNVTKRFGSKTAVDNLSLELQPGTITGFIGPNGAGKTTTIRMICGILQPDHGEVYIKGINMKEDPLKAKESFGYISDNPDLFTALKGIEYINFICNIYKVDPAIRADRLADLAKDFEMEENLSQRISSYSHGMRQKIHIIATLMHDPDIWILDEPMTGLDPRSSYLLKERMRKHAAKGNTVLFSTHVLEVAEKLCDMIAIINKGKLVYTGTLDDLKAQHPGRSLEEIFLIVTDSKIVEEDGPASVKASEGTDSAHGQGSEAHDPAKAEFAGAKADDAAKAESAAESAKADDAAKAESAAEGAETDNAAKAGDSQQAGPGED